MISITISICLIGISISNILIMLNVRKQNRLLQEMLEIDANVKMDLIATIDSYKKNL